MLNHATFAAINVLGFVRWRRAERAGLINSKRDRSTERILCAALWVDTGEADPPRRTYSYPATGILFCGWRHCDCFVPLNAWSDRLSVEERTRIGEEQIAGRHQGFITSTGRFVNREEAMTIAKLAGQTDSKSSGLSSEDIY